MAAMPINEINFHLSKRDFRDALALRYTWPLCDVLAVCTCSKAFIPTHGMCCATGGFPTIRHNEVGDIMADLITEVCSDVAEEPLLTGEKFMSATANTVPDVRADNRAGGFR